MRSYSTECSNEKTDLFHDMTRSELNKLLVICTQQSHFQFDGKFYDQVDGVAMGSPLGPLFANIFMAELEQKHMNTLKKKGIILWKRYVDDVFAIVRDKSSANECLEFLNTMHINIKFTIEHESDNKLAFLDTCVKRDDTRYYTTLYHKKTITGVYLNWTSLTARRYKIGLNRCLLSPIYAICTDQKDKPKGLTKRDSSTKSRKSTLGFYIGNLN